MTGRAEAANILAAAAVIMSAALKPEFAAVFWMTDAEPINAVVI